METSEKPQHHGGIVNYFQGATIHNLVINGNMTKSGNENFHAKEGCRTRHTDQQIARAITAINGKQKAINSKQKMAGVYWYLRWAEGWPVSSQQFCERMGKLAFSQPLPFPCDHRNIREWATLSFMDEDATQLEKVRYSKNDEGIYFQCREVVVALRNELQKTEDEQVLNG